MYIFLDDLPYSNYSGASPSPERGARIGILILRALKARGAYYSWRVQGLGLGSLYGAFVFVLSDIYLFEFEGLFRPCTHSRPEP